MTRPPSKPKPGAKTKAVEADGEKKSNRSGLMARYLAPPGFVKLRGQNNNNKKRDEGKEGGILRLRILKKEEFRMEISEPGLMSRTLHVPDSVEDAEKLGRHDSHHAQPLLLPTKSQDGNSSAETMAGSQSTGSGSSTVLSESSGSWDVKRADEQKVERGGGGGGGGEEEEDNNNRTHRPPFHRNLRKPTSSPLLSPSLPTPLFSRPQLTSRPPLSSHKPPPTPSRLFHLPTFPHRHTTPSPRTHESEKPPPAWYTAYQAAKRETERLVAKEKKVAREKRKAEAKKREKEERRERERVGVEMLRREGVVVGGGMGLGMGMGGGL